jgi:Zn-dependent metalloprotease
VNRTVVAGSGVAALAAAVLAAPIASAAPSGGDLVLVQTRQSLLGTHTWYAQTFHGLPVLNAYYAKHIDRSGQVTVDDGRVSVPASLSAAPTVSAATAESAARSSLTAAATTQRAAAARQDRPGKNTPAAITTGSSQRARLAVLGGANARLVWQVTATGDDGSSEAVVDARSGKVISQRSLVKRENGTGRVFSPNPVVALQNENLTAKNDADQSVLRPAYRKVTLTNLNSPSHRLRGDYAWIMNKNGARSATNTFNFFRHNNYFEQVQAYYDVTQAQLYLRSLGFTDVNAEPQKIRTNTIPDDNSFYDPAVDEITFGRGGVDDAEDQEVVWHELGHAIQDDQVPGFGESDEGGGIGEGFGDYWAVTLSEPVSNGFDLPCVMDWDATSYTSGPSHCLRRTDGTKTTDDIVGEVHDDGEIWSRALWDIHLDLGRTRADTVIIESHFVMSPDTNFAQAAERTVQTAQALYGSSTAAQVRQAFVDRKILS